MREGSSGFYTLSLTERPEEEVEINFELPDTRISNIAPLIIEPSAWDQEQKINLSISTDSLAQGLLTLPIKHTVKLKDQIKESTSQNLIIQDLNTANILRTPTTFSLSLKEGTKEDTQTFVLTSSPTSPVKIALRFDPSQKMSINGDSSGTYNLIFHSGNWDQAQTLTFSSPFSSGLGDRVVTVTSTVESEDLNYHQFILEQISVSILSNKGSSVGSVVFQKGNEPSGFSIMNVILGTQVNPSKAFVYCNFEYQSSQPYNATTCQLNSTGTQIQLRTGGGTAAKVNWYVVEMEQGLKSERGNIAFSEGESLKTITLSSSFLPASSFVLLFSRIDTTNVSLDAERLFQGKLTSATNIEISRGKFNTPGVTSRVEWQVVQLDGAKVQSGITSLTNTSNQIAVNLANPVSLSKSFLFFNQKTNLSTGQEQDYATRARFSSSNSILFERDGTNGNLDISYFTIEMLDTTKVQSGHSLLVGITDTTATANLSETVNVDRTMVVFSNSISGADSSYVDSGTFSVLFSPLPLATQLNFTRNNHEDHPCTINWFTIEFPP